MIPAIVLGLLEKQSKFYGLCVSAVFLVLLFSQDVQGGAAFVIFVLWSLLLAFSTLRIFAKANSKRKLAESEQEKLIAEAKFSRAVLLYKFALVLQIAPLAAAKVLGVFDISLVGFIGISYITFKAVQVLIEIRDGLIVELSPVDYLYFLMFFPVFTSGPILRSRDFVAQIARPAKRGEYIELVAHGALYFVKGFVYTFLFAALFQWLMWFVPESVSQNLPLHGAISAVSETFFYGLYLFFDFAGYSFMAMGVGACLGVKVPTNFNAPFLSIDIKDFWNRWHITLSYWLRDYVFMRMSKGLIRRKVFSSRTTTACFGFLAEMALMGVWHGLTLSNITYGIYHGCLLALCEIFQKKSKFYKKHKRQRWFKVLSWAVTMIAIFFGFCIFSGQFYGDLLGY
jgi:membrane protein involved in D-alanine export